MGNSDIAYALSAGTNVAITSTAGGGATGDINVNASVLSHSTTELSLDAASSVFVNAALAAGSADVTVHGAIFFNVPSATAVLTTGGQSYNGPVEFESDTALASTAAGAITFKGTVDGAHLLNVDTAGIVAFNDIVGGTSPLAGLLADAAHSSGTIQFNMAVSGGASAGVAVGSLTLDGTALFNIQNSSMSAPSVRTGDAQNYNGPVLLGTDSVFVSTGGGSIAFNSTVDSATAPSALSVDASGKIYFGNNVGLAGPLTAVSALAGQGVTRAAGTTINTLTGVVSSAPPILFAYQTTPGQEQVFPSQLTQTVYGYIGFVGAPSGYTELGQNYDIEVLWADGSVTMSDSQSLLIARPSPGHGDFVGYGTVATMTSVPGSPGAWTYNDTTAGLPAFFPAAAANGITFAISHTYDLSFVTSHEGGKLTAVVKLVNNSSIQLSNPAQDGNIVSGTPPAAGSLNAVQAAVSVPITSAYRGVPTPPAFVLPAVADAREVLVAPAIASTPPRQAVNAPNDLVVRQDTIVVERRMIEIVKLDPDGNAENETTLTDVPEKLNELLEKLKLGTYRNGRYAVYLTEYSVTGQVVVGRRLLMEVYKSGRTLGDPVHEPGPSSNPLQKETPKQEPPAAPSVPAPHSAAAPAERTLAVRMAATDARSPGADAWASRVDQALGDNPTKSLRRMARLARASAAKSGL